MPKRLIFMNHRLKDEANRKAARPKPVITVQDTDGQHRHGHRVELRDGTGELIATVRWNPKGSRSVRTHRVLAWIEVSGKAQVRIRPQIRTASGGQVR